jgi:hypothetical protein
LQNDVQNPEQNELRKKLQKNEGEKGITAASNLTFHLGCPGARLIKISRSPVEFHLITECIFGFFASHVRRNGVAL